MKTKLSHPIARLLLAILMCLPICGSHASAQEAESYAVFDEATNTLTFKHDTNKPAGAFALNEGENAPGWYKTDGYGHNKNIIKKVIFDASFANARPTSCYEWFYSCPHLTTIEGIEYLNTTNVTNMSWMFCSCSALTTLDVSNFDTKNVTEMREMFGFCGALTTLDISNFNTKNVTNMYGMFRGCDYLETLDLSNFNTQNVTDMMCMFNDCSALKTLDLSSFETQNVTNMGDMFSNCKALTTLDVSKFDTKNVTNMSGMFQNCKALTTLDVSKFDTQNVTNISGMFYNCNALTTLDVSNFDTKNVERMYEMFRYCHALTTIYASEKFVTTACGRDRYWYMFADCANLVGAVPYDGNKVDGDMANYTTGYFTYKAPTETYAVFDEATNTLTFKRDNNKPAGAFALNEDYNTPGWYKPNDDGSNANIIKKVVFDASFANARPTSCYEWFFGCTDLTSIEGIEYLNTENVTDMSGMFYGCSALTTLDVSNFDTKNVTNMSNMFHWCLALTTLDVSNFDTKNVTNMRGMFYNCHALTTLNVSNFDTQNVTNMSNMFSVCFALTTLDVSNFDTQNVTNMSWMFSYDTALTTIYASDKFVTTACEVDENMFAECANLMGAVPYDENKVGKEMANYTTGYFTDIASKVVESYAVFDEATNTLTFKHDTKKPYGAFALNEGDNAPGWNDESNANIIKKVVFDASFANARPTSCYRWFDGCDKLTTIEGIEYLNTENVTNMGLMFSNCWALTTLDVSKFDTKNVTNISGMFSSCEALTTLDVSNFDTQNVTDMSDIFNGCKALTTLDVSNFDTKNVTDMSGMFWVCAALTTLDVSHFDTQNVTNMNGMFCDCSALTTLDVSNFDTKNVTNMSGMFCDCSALTTLDVSNFDTKNVTNMNYMFSGCKALTTLDVSNFDTKNVTNMSDMFSDCPALTTIYASEKFVTTACEEAENMFAECANLVGAVPYDENKVGKEMANYTNGYFTDKAATGIDAPTVSDDTAAEYYDLQGRRLNAPQKGVNIVKRGKKTTKMLVK